MAIVIDVALRVRLGQPCASAGVTVCFGWGNLRRFRFEWTAVVLCTLAPPTCPRALNQPPCFGADQPPPPLSFALRPRRNRPPWAGPSFLRRDKSSLPIASVHCLSEPPATGEPTKPLGCPS